MNNRIQNALENVRAEDALKQRTLEYLQKESAHKRIFFSRNMWRYVPVMASCIMVILLGTAGYSAWARPVSYISMDVNPSIELELNRFDRVVLAKSYNDEGKDILKEVSVRGKTYADAIEMLVNSPDMQEYLHRNEIVEFAVASDVTGKAIGLENGIENLNVDAVYRSDCETTDMSTVQEAHDNDISIGKYMIYQELLRYDETVTVEKCRHSSMAELHDELNRHGAGHGGHVEHGREQDGGEQKSQPEHGKEQNGGEQNSQPEHGKEQNGGEQKSQPEYGGAHGGGGHGVSRHGHGHE